MPWTGIGSFVRLRSWLTDQANGLLVRADLMDSDSNDIASGISNCIARDGQAPALANISFGGFKLTNLAVGVASTDAVNFGQVFTGGTFGTATLNNTTMAGTLSLSGVTGTVNLTGVTAFNVPTPAVGDNSTKVATTAFATALAFTAVLPAQLGNAGKVTTTDGTTASWSALKTINGSSILGVGNIQTGVVRSARTSNTILAAADSTTLIDVTSGTFTQTFTAAATLGSGWWCYYRNSGTGDITLDPNGAELIDGLTSYIMYPGEARLIVCDGSAFYSIVLRPFSRAWTASGTFTKPPGYSYFGGLIWNAGSSGRKGGASDAFGGGGGGCFPFQILASALASSETITIGAGGASQTVADTAGNVGGVSSLGTTVVMVAAPAYNKGSSVTVGIATAVDATGFEATDTSGKNTIYGGTAANSAGTTAAGNSVYGGAAGGSISAAGAIAAPGTSKLGGGGGIHGDAVSGTAGSAPGGGGGGTRTGTASGPGARGELRIWGLV